MKGTNQAYRWGSWKYIILNGRIRKRIQNPTRWHYQVRQTLKRIRVPFREVFPFKNPLYRGWKNRVEFAIQWLDFVIYAEGMLMVIVFKELERHARQKDAWRAKQEYLVNRGIPFLILGRKPGVQEYEIIIRNFIRRESKLKLQGDTT